MHREMKNFEVSTKRAAWHDDSLVLSRGGKGCQCPGLEVGGPAGVKAWSEDMTTQTRAKVWKPYEVSKTKVATQDGRPSSAKPEHAITSKWTLCRAGEQLWIAEPRTAKACIERNGNIQDGMFAKYAQEDRGNCAVEQ